MKIKKNIINVSCMLALLLGANIPIEASAAGGSKICLTNSGDLRVKGSCKSRRGETAITSANIATIADIGLAGIPSGNTVYGVIGGDFDVDNASSTLGVTSSLPAVVDPSLTSADIIVDTTTELATACSGDASTCLSAAEVAAASTCTGSTTSPSAPAGKLCIYPYTLTNASSITGSSPAAGANVGFTVDWTAASTGDTKFGAVWAYTAP